MTSVEKWRLKLIPLLGIGTWVYFFILCVLLFKERIIHADTAYYLHTIVQSDYLFLGPRPVGALTQWLPILFVQLNISLNWVVMSYSLSFALLYGTIAYLAYHLVPKPNTVIVMALVTLIAAGHVVFNPGNETTLALLLCAGFHVVWFEFRGNQTQILRWASTLFLILSLLSHPSSAVLLLFSGLYAEAEFRFRTFPWGQIGIFGLSVAVLVVSITVWGGDSNPQSGFVYSMLNPDHWHFTLQTPGINYFLRHLGTDSIFYLPTALLLVIGSTYLVIQKKLLQALLIFIYFILILLLNAAMYFDGESAVVMEKGILPVSLVVLAFVVSIDFKTRPLAIWVSGVLFAALALWRFNTILHTGKLYTKRIEAYFAFMDESEAPKTIIGSDHPLSSKLKMIWCSGIESLYLSVLREGGQTQKTVFIQTGQIPEHWLTDPQLFLGPTFWPEHSALDLNRRYFSLPVVPYNKVELN